MSSNKKFDLDLSKGIEMEEKLAEFFEGKFVEVKSERYIWEKTGNHFLEYESYGKPSGIAVTESDYWALMLVKEINGVDVPVMTYIVPVETMKKLGRKYIHTKTKGGDDNMSKGVLVPIKEIALACLNNDRE